MKRVFRNNIFIFTLAVIYTLAFPLFFTSLSYLSYANSIIPLFVLVLFWVFFQKVKHHKITERHKWALIYASIISLMLVTGKILIERQKEFFGFYLIISWVLITVFIFCIVVMAWEHIDKINKRSNENVKKGKMPWCGVVLCFVLLMFMWLPSWLATFPGTFFGDNAIQLLEYENGEVSRSFPIFHTYFIGAIISLGKAIGGTYNAGVALCVFVQMCILAATFTIVIKFIYERAQSKIIPFAVWGMYAFLPVIRLFCKDLVRDVLFSSFMVMVSMVMYYALHESEKITASWIRMVLVGLVCFVAINLRNVAIVFFVVTALFLAIRCIKNIKQNGKMLSILLAVLVINALYTNLIQDKISIPNSLVAGVGSSSLKENLSVPLQQMARVMVEQKDSLREEDIIILNELFPNETAFLYDAQNADAVKWNMNNEAFENAPFRYIKEWFSLGVRYPMVYVKAFLDLNYEIWYPDTILDGYNKGDTWYYMGGTAAPAYLDSKIPVLYELENKIATEISFSRIPIIAFLFSPAIMLYIMLFSLCYLLYRKETKGIVLLFPALLVHIGTLFCPVVVVRYNLLSFFMVPVAIALLFIPELLVNKE